jgi:hypothetical protein
MISHLTITFRSICAIAMLFCISASAAPEKQGGRFLFLVETSSAMDGNKVALRKTLRSVIESGLNGQMQYGDTMGLWTYNDLLNTTFPMIIWQREHAQDITNAVEFFMAKQKFVHRGDFSKVLPVLQNIIKPSQKLTIIWISSGNDKISGTPFDASIEELHKEFRDDFRKQHIPFVTLLAVRNGAIVDFTVNPGDSKIRLPAIMEKEAAEPKVAASKPPAAPAVAPATPKKPSLVIKVGPSPEAVEQQKAAEAAKVQANPPVAVAAPPTTTNATVAAPAPASTNTVAVVTNKPAPTLATNVTAPVQTNAVAASNSPTPAVASAPPSTTNAIAVSNVPAVVTTVIKSQPVQEQTPTPAVAVTAQFSSLSIAIGAGALVLVAGIIFLVMKQASAPKGPSFISQSMTRERVNSDASKPSSDNPVDHD